MQLRALVGRPRPADAGLRGGDEGAEARGLRQGLQALRELPRPARLRVRDSQRAVGLAGTPFVLS